MDYRGTKYTLQDVNLYMYAQYNKTHRFALKTQTTVPTQIFKYTV